MSPHSLRANSVVDTPGYVSAYSFAYDFSVKQNPYNELAKQTFPTIGDTCGFVLP